MLIVGLTGGIGSGKTTVAKCFAELGATVIDADIIARDLVAKDKAIATKISEHFGSAVLDKSNQIDRSKLRDIIFNNAQEREWLEKLLHPLITAEIERRVKASESSYCVLVIPLLFEKGAHIKVDRTLVIDTSEGLQIQRTQQRDAVNEEHVRSIMLTQTPRKERLQKANDVIDNYGTLDELKRQILRLHEKYKTYK